MDHPRVVCGTSESDWAAVLAHGASDGRVLPMLGLHPWFVAAAKADWAFRLEALLRVHPAGVGECGLDYSQKEADRPAQELAFRVQLRLAHTLRLRRQHRQHGLDVVRVRYRLSAGRHTRGEDTDHRLHRPQAIGQPTTAS